MHQSMISIKKDEWGTPKALFNEYDKEFNFTLDPCGHPDRLLREDLLTLGLYNNKKEHPFYFIQDGLEYSWKDESIFCNPPYMGRGTIAKWIKKAFENRFDADCIVFLIPTYTDRNFFHDYVKNYAEVRFIKNRITFVPLHPTRSTHATFPSMFIIYRRD